MQPFEQWQGIVAPLDRHHVDTDAIIPKQFLKSVSRTGFGDNLFDEWRYLDSGEPGQDCTQRPRNESFVLNQAPYQHASILLARDNFGCGSSREHAVWAFIDAGFHCVIAPSFADIFHNNSLKNGLLTVVLSHEQIDHLFNLAEEQVGMELVVNLPDQQVILPDQTAYSFEIDPFRKTCLLQGLDDIDLTLQFADDIRDYEQQRRQQAPWLFPA